MSSKDVRVQKTKSGDWKVVLDGKPLVRDRSKAKAIQRARSLSRKYGRSAVLSTSDGPVVLRQVIKPGRAKDLLQALEW